MSEQLAAELTELNRIRLDEDLTYEALAEEIRAAGVGDVDASVIYRALNEPGRKPHDRTLHKFRRFLDHRRSQQRRRGGRP